jgi:hypothetical protein
MMALLGIRAPEKGKDSLRLKRKLAARDAGRQLIEVTRLVITDVERRAVGF